MQQKDVYGLQSWDSATPLLLLSFKMGEAIINILFTSKVFKENFTTELDFFNQQVLF